MALNVKVGLIGPFDMLKFKNVAKTREKAIQAASANEIVADYAINRNAKALHPDYLSLVVAEILDHGKAGAKTFVFKNANGGSLPYFRAGQYLSLKLDLDGSRVSRPYSISSGPKEALEGRLAVTVRANPGGFAADRILAGLMSPRSPAILPDAPEKRSAARSYRARRNMPSTLPPTSRSLLRWNAPASKRRPAAAAASAAGAAASLSPARCIAPPKTRDAVTAMW